MIVKKWRYRQSSFAGSKLGGDWLHVNGDASIDGNDGAGDPGAGARGEE